MVHMFMYACPSISEAPISQKQHSPENVFKIMSQVRKTKSIVCLSVCLPLEQRRMLSFHMSDGLRMGSSRYLSESQNESSPGKWKQKISLSLSLSISVSVCLSAFVSLCLYVSL